MSCTSHDDLDVFIQLRKASKDEDLLQNINIPLKDLDVSSPADVVPVNANIYLGPLGILRVSHRSIDRDLAGPHEITYAHTEAEIRKVNRGDVVRLEISVVPTAILFEAGEKLVLKVAGHPLSLAETEPLRGALTGANQGRHCIHFGGKFDSKLEIPLVEV